FYSFSYSGKFNLFDWSVYWSDTIARVLLPALFLHFALAFPEPKAWFARRRWLFGLLYLPAAVLGVAHVLTVGAPLLPPSLELFGVFDRIELTHLAVLFLLAAGVFEYTYRTSTNPLLAQQMKLVTRGTWLAILPFSAFYVLPIFLDPEYVPNDWMKLSTLSLVFIPLTFGYAIIRYRLMDVDIIFRRGVAYTLATAAIGGLYFGLAIVLAEGLQLRVGLGSGGVIIALIIAAVFFEPIKNWTQMQLERLFYRERFDLRRTLEGFGRELSSEVHLDRLMEKILDRLARTLPMERIAIFLEDEDQPGRYRLARGQGVGRQRAGAVLTLSEPIGAGHLYVESGAAEAPLDPPSQGLLEDCSLNYLIPCRIQQRTIALLALGKPTGGLLTSEDLELLETLADYLAIALENARLYARLEQKAEQIAQLKDFSESILESTSVGLVAVDPEGCIESWNSSMERLMGRPRAEAFGRRLAEVLPADLVEEVDARKRDARPSSLYRFYLTRPDGQRRVTNIALTPLISKQGQSIGRLLIFDDVSDRAQFEDQLLQAEKLSSIGLLAAGVAHEVNTPLAVISNYAQMLAKETAPGDPRAALVEKIVKQTFRASEIISSLLNFSRTGPAEFSSVDVNQTLADTLALVEPHLRSTQVQVETELGEDLPPILGDTGKLQQVFLNLFFNARDAMPKGGRLRVRTARQNSRVQVEIGDTGVGIPPENLGKVYDPFFTTKSTGRGTGLGLAVTYGIVQEHNGSIQVSSRAGEGTTFLLEFPALVRAAEVS
ncbi:MAG: ATP-binding protein, partial [Candidatus Acidiferrales bacterium]